MEKYLLKKIYLACHVSCHMEREMVGYADFVFLLPHGIGQEDSYWAKS